MKDRIIKVFGVIGILIFVPILWSFTNALIFILIPLDLFNYIVLNKDTFSPRYEKFNNVFL